jgi:hypothetical protein
MSSFSQASLDLKNGIPTFGTLNQPQKDMIKNYVELYKLHQSNQSNVTGLFQKTLYDILGRNADCFMYIPKQFWTEKMIVLALNAQHSFISLIEPEHVTDNVVNVFLSILNANSRKMSDITRLGCNNSVAIHVWHNLFMRNVHTIKHAPKRIWTIDELVDHVEVYPLNIAHVPKDMLITVWNRLSNETKVAIENRAFNKRHGNVASTFTKISDRMEKLRLKKELAMAAKRKEFRELVSRRERNQSQRIALSRKREDLLAKRQLEEQHNGVTADVIMIGLKISSVNGRIQKLDKERLLIMNAILDCRPLVVA